MLLRCQMVEWSLVPQTAQSKVTKNNELQLTISERCWLYFTLHDLYEKTCA